MSLEIEPFSLTDNKLVAAQTATYLYIKLYPRDQTVLDVRCYSKTTGSPLYGMLYIGGVLVDYGWFGNMDSYMQFKLGWIGSRFIAQNERDKNIVLRVINNGEDARQLELTATMVNGYVAGSGGSTVTAPKTAIWNYEGYVTQPVGVPDPMGMEFKMAAFHAMKLLSYSIGPDAYAAGRVITVSHGNYLGDVLSLLDVVTVDTQVAFGPKQAILQHDDVSSTPAHVGAPPQVIIGSTDELIFTGAAIINAEVLTVHLRALLLTGTRPVVTAIGAGVILTPVVDQIVGLVPEGSV